MSDPRLTPSLRMTEAEFLALGENNYRQELIDGELHMSNANSSHTEICFAMKLMLTPAVKRAGFEVRMTPNLRLSPTDYYIPDIAIGAFRRSMTFYAAAEAVLVAEITSPGNASTDRIRKKQHYARAGIPWYLLGEPDYVDYRHITLSLFRLDGDSYAEHTVAKPGETLTAGIPFPIALSTDALVDFT